MQDSGVDFVIAESGNVLGHAQRSVIKGPVTVQRAASLAQVPGPSADLRCQSDPQRTYGWEGQFIGQLAKLVGVWISETL